MNQLFYFRNARRDGGVRIGVELNGERIFHQFTDGPDVKDITDENPALDWFFDLFFEGKSIPEEPEKVRRWLVGADEYVRSHLAALAGEFAAGIDENAFPITQEWSDPYRRAKVSCKISAVRSVRHDDLAKSLRELAKNWRQELKNLPVAEPDLI